MSSLQNTNTTQKQLGFWKLTTYITLIVALLTVLFPFLWLVSTSLKPDLKAVLTQPPQFIPRPPTFANYREAWQSAPFGRYTFNSIFVALSVTVLQLINGSLCAYVFARIKFWGRELLFMLFLVVMMVPTPVTIVPLYSLMTHLNWLDSYQALIIPFAANAFGVFLIRQAFLGVPNELIDAAVVDGAGHFRILRSVLVPLSKPSLITYALLTFKWRWNEYLWVIIMTSSDAVRTLPVGVVSMQGSAEGGANWHIVMAAIVIVLIPLLFLFIVAQKYFVQGVTNTGLKG